MNNIDKMSWCLKNGIKIPIDAVKHTSIKVTPMVKLTIVQNGKTTKGQIEYKQDDKLIDVVTELYGKLYDRIK